MAGIKKSELREILLELSDDVKRYFAEARKVISERQGDQFLPSYPSKFYYWSQLTEDLQSTANDIVSRLLPPCSLLAELARSSTLTGIEDLHDVKVATKAMRASLRLCRYRYHESEVIHDEGVVIGFRSADQSESEGLYPREAEGIFYENLSVLGSVLKLVEASGSISPGSLLGGGADHSKYRAGTAFIMMWMDPDQSELIDVADAVRSVFRKFGIRAQRADDIEHEGLITERILNEIRSSEFLFADMTGMRPNVYYEVGYAHALEKRVILFRKSGTNLHFDLAGYNCPEYKNLRDLREKLTKRLIDLTNRNPIEEKEH